jgi:hypothetical protein
MGLTFGSCVATLSWRSSDISPEGGFTSRERCTAVSMDTLPQNSGTVGHFGNSGIRGVAGLRSSDSSRHSENVSAVGL